MPHKLYIIGSGAIGKALAVFLTHQQREVVLIRGSSDDGTHYQEKIELTLSDHTNLVAEVEVDSLRNHPVLEGVVILTNKSFGNQKLASALKGRLHAPLVILQNGLGVEQPFIDNGFQDVYRCVLFATSQITDNGKLRFKPVAVSPVGIIKGDERTLNAVVNSITTPVFQFRAEQDIQLFIWKKAIANSVFNSICTLLEVDNGIFHRNEEAMRLAKRIVKECVAIAQQSGVQLQEQDVVDSILLISNSSDGQLISTLQDIRNKRETEIDMLNFEFVRIAEKSGRADQITETNLLGELVKIKSDLNRR
ncbi:MAG: ketopantoate reductase [Azospira oryzae]|jgi:2-dehydropantoate 2-reductase|nr:MAG: ketopantoate reductase [Azospira oryzae]